MAYQTLDDLDSIINLLNSMSRNQQFQKSFQDREDSAIQKQKEKQKERIDNSLTNIDSLINELPDTNSLLYMQNNLYANESSYSQYPDTRIKAATTNQKIQNKLQERRVYENIINQAKDKYIGIYDKDGTQTTSGIRDWESNFDKFTDDVVENWTYDKIADELNFLDDFEMLVTGKEGVIDKSQFIGKYNPGGVTDLQLIDRMGDYRKQLEAALFADATNARIEDHELYGVFTGDKEKLENDRTSNMESANDNIDKYDRAMGSIKKSRNNLKSKLAGYTAKDLKQAEESGGLQITYAAADVKTLNALTDIAKSEFEIDNKGFENFEDYKEDYFLEKGQVDIRDFLRDLEAEIELYEGLKQKEKIRYKKWSGNEYRKSSKQLKDIYKDKFAELIFGQEIETFNYRDEKNPPQDLEFDKELDLFFSPTLQKYYDKDSVIKFFQE